MRPPIGCASGDLWFLLSVLIPNTWKGWKTSIPFLILPRCFDHLREERMDFPTFVDSAKSFFVKKLSFLSTRKYELLGWIGRYFSVWIVEESLHLMGHPGWWTHPLIIHHLLEDATAFVAKLLQRSPIKRYTAQEASHLNHGSTFCKPETYWAVKHTGLG